MLQNIMQTCTGPSNIPFMCAVPCCKIQLCQPDLLVRQQNPGTVFQTGKVKSGVDQSNADNLVCSQKFRNKVVIPANRYNTGNPKNSRSHRQKVENNKAVQ